MSRLNASHRSGENCCRTSCISSRSARPRPQGNRADRAPARAEWRVSRRARPRRRRARWPGRRRRSAARRSTSRTAGRCACRRRERTSGGARRGSRTAAGRGCRNRRTRAGAPKPQGDEDDRRWGGAAAGGAPSRAAAPAEHRGRAAARAKEISRPPSGQATAIRARAVSAAASYRQQPGAAPAAGSGGDPSRVPNNTRCKRQHQVEETGTNGGLRAPRATPSRTRGGNGDGAAPEPAAR